MRSPAISSPVATAFTALAARLSPARDQHVRARLSAGLARYPLRYPTGLGRIDLCATPARLCAVLDALVDAEPLLPAMQSRGRPRIVAGRTVLGGTEAAARRRGARMSRHRPLGRKEHRAVAQLRRRADAVRPAISCRRRRP